MWLFILNILYVTVLFHNKLYVVIFNILVSKHVASDGCDDIHSCCVCRATWRDLNVHSVNPTHSTWSNAIPTDVPSVSVLASQHAVTSHNWHVLR